MEEMARTIAAGLAERREELSEAIGLEGLISALTLEARGGRGSKGKGQDLPRAVRPARSRSAAREALRATMAALEEAGAAEEVPAEEGAREFPALGRSGNLRYMRLHLDEVLAEWVAALQRQAHGRAGGRGPRPAVAKKRPKKRRR